MSAIRNSSNRSEARKQRSNPYGRGLFSAVTRFVKFFVGGADEQPVEADGSDSIGQASVARSNGRNAVQSPKSLLISDHRVPLTPSKAGNGFPPAESSTLPVPSSEQVASYFSQRMGTNVTPNEVESMITNLQTTPEQERFRFTFTSPSRELYSSPPIVTNDSPRTTPSKKLSRNPNGVYRWEGAGSAKSSRRQNRFGSPAFGASPTKAKASSSKDTTEQADLPVQDSKRRKVADGVAVGVPSSGPSQSTSSTIPFPTTSPTTPRANGILRQTSPLPSRLRTPAKATAPVHPSPLRQAWSDASSTSSHEDRRPSPPVKQTKTANFVAELIKETAPPNKPDLTNPYQAASPVGKAAPPRRASKRPAPPSRKYKEDKQKKEEAECAKALSAQAIIEATLPKGSKRSRPPPHLEKKTGDTPRSGSPPQPTPRVSCVVEEVEDEEPERVTKRLKPSLEGQGLPSLVRVVAPSDVTIEEIQDVDMAETDKGQDKEKVAEARKPTSSSNGSRSTQVSSFKPSSVPKEPSKLRFSIQAESPPSSNAPTPSPAPAAAEVLALLPSAGPGQSSHSIIPAPSPPSIQTTANGFSFSFKAPTPRVSTEEIKNEDLPKEIRAEPVADAKITKTQVRSMDVKLLPTFVLTSTGTTVLPSTPEHTQAREAARGLPLSSLPTFDFSSSAPFSFGLSPAKPSEASAPSFNPFSTHQMPPASTANMFGAMPPPKPPVSVAAPPAVNPSPAPIKAFDFAAAGMAQPTTSNDMWKCVQCGLSNPQTAAKCTICDEPKTAAVVVSKPSSPTSVAVAPTPPPPVKAFDWSAAGMKPPTANSDTWTCGLCGLSNPKSAAKCTTCDAAAPGDSTSANSPQAKPSLPSTFNMFAAAAPKPASVKGFDFAAAGMKPPVIERGTWVCSLCGLSNLETASSCKTCENPK